MRHKNPDSLASAQGEFTRADALKLCELWQSYIWKRSSGSWQADGIESAIEELCLAWGYTVEEIRATWKSPGSEKYKTKVE